MSLISFFLIKMQPLPFREGSNEKNARPFLLVYHTYSKAGHDVLNVVRFIVYLRVVTRSTLHNEMRPRGPPMGAPVYVRPFFHVL
jgi:hypothetical protein